MLDISRKHLLFKGKDNKERQISTVGQCGEKSNMYMEMEIDRCHSILHSVDRKP